MDFFFFLKTLTLQTVTVKKFFIIYTTNSVYATVKISVLFYLSMQFVTLACFYTLKTGKKSII